MNWQPIESAPKDGTHVLLGCFGDGGTMWMYVCWWKHKKWLTHESTRGDYWSVISKATHWMPLPPPPEKS